MTATPPRPGAVASAKIVSRSAVAPALLRIWSNLVMTAKEALGN